MNVHTNLDLTLPRPATATSTGLFLAFSSVTPRHYNFLGAYPDFFFCHAPPLQLPRGFSWLFLLSRPVITTSSGLFLTFHSI